MTGKKSLFRSDERGSYIIEFAIIVLPMMTFLLGAIEVGYYSYAKARTEGIIREVSRLSATGYFLTSSTTDDTDDGTAGGADDDARPPTSLELIAAYVAERINGIPGASFDVDVKSYQDFQDIENPEPITNDAIPLGGTPGVDDCFIDVDGDGQWTANISGADGVGGSEDIVYFGLAVSYEPIFDLSKSFAGDALVIDLNAAIKNEPYGSAASYAREEICITE